MKQNLSQYDYVKNGGLKCPRCGSDNIGQSAEDLILFGQLIRYFHCYACGFDGADKYLLVGYAAGQEADRPHDDGVIYVPFTLRDSRRDIQGTVRIEDNTLLIQFEGHAEYGMTVEMSWPIDIEFVNGEIFVHVCGNKDQAMPTVSEGLQNARDVSNVGNSRPTPLPPSAPVHPDLPDAQS